MEQDTFFAFIPLAAIIFGPTAWVLVTWMRTRQDVAGRAGSDADRKIALLWAENERLIDRTGRLEERIAVLERIATDPAARTAREIDALR